jgi:ubiquinone biosynthesis monooxygenase Coq7
MTSTVRSLGALDRALIRAQAVLAVCHGPHPAPTRASPARALPEATLGPQARRHAAGLMRVNHAGEVCAQALYLGQAAMARREPVRAALLRAADEEADHLAWCAERLEALKAAPSALGLGWFAGSFAIGAGAALASDALSLGFIVETERQVEAHLGDHLVRLPAEDSRSRSVLQQMQQDEAMHGERAAAAGAAPLPEPIPRLMAAAAAVMKWLAYRI